MAKLVEISREKVLCPQCQTDGKKSKVILYPGQTIPKMKYTDGYWNENGISLNSMPRLNFRGISVVMDMLHRATQRTDE